MIETPPSNLDIDLARLFHEASNLGASDIIIKGGESPSFKIDGRWQRSAHPPLTDAQAESFILSLFPRSEGSPEASDRMRRPIEQDFSLPLPDGTRLRINTFLAGGFPAAVIRIIPNQIRPLDDLGIPLAPLEAALTRRKGLILVTGATGSGKSTTLAAMVHWLNQRYPLHIVTVEDPIEFYHEPAQALITQREVGTDTQDFASALRSVLRQSPDVILVGEMRDLETISAAITAAETGHLVMSTLHTNSAAEAIDRIVDVFPEGQRALVRTQLANALNLVLCQALLPRKDGPGRALIYELMVNTPAIASAIRDGKIAQIPSMMQTGAQFGMTLMQRVAADLAARGVIEREQAEAIGRIGG